METPYRTLFKGLAWNTFESIIYQSLLVIHFIVLYRHTDPSLFGTIGVIFSLVYLMTFIVNGGLDTALAPYARLLMNNRHFWRAIFIPHLIVQLIICAAIGILSIGINIFFLHRLSYMVSSILALVLITETTKKTIRTVAHLTFHNQLTALVELATLSIYLSMVWTSYFFYTGISLILIFLPLFITSLLSCLILGIAMYHFYMQLPDNDELPIPPNTTFIRTRFYTYGTHLGHILFSSNFLIPFFAFHIGLAHTGIFKLMSSITHTITSMLYKIFGPTSQALFSHMVNRSAHEKQQLFFTLTEYLHHVLYGLIIFFTINYTKLIGTHEGINNSLVILFLLIQLTEHMFIVYEKFFIAHHQAAYLCLLSFISLVITGTLLLLPLPSSPLTIMGIVLCIRIVALSIMGVTAYHRFHIKPALTMRADFIILALSIAGIFFICF